jgi:hypothetical protein
MSWNGYPLVYMGNVGGWCFRAPKDSAFRDPLSRQDFEEYLRLHKKKEKRETPQDVLHSVFSLYSTSSLTQLCKNLGILSEENISKTDLIKSLRTFVENNSYNNFLHQIEGKTTSKRSEMVFHYLFDKELNEWIVNLVSIGRKKESYKKICDALGLKYKKTDTIPDIVGMIIEHRKNDASCIINWEEYRKEQVESLSAEEKYLQLFDSDPEGTFYRLPNLNNLGENCGSPLQKAFMGYFADDILSSEDPIAQEVLESNIMCSYWNSSRERIKKQFIVSKKDLHKMDPQMFPLEEGNVILPPIIVMGTLTRRAVESTWLTASNAKKNRIGSELKTLVKAPEGYSIIGADVDSQELWIASLLGDSQFGTHGASALGWMTLQGSRTNNTDLHSRSAEILKSSRDHAKIFNYARIYGSGIKFSSNLLIKFNPIMSLKDAEMKAKDLYKATKGQKWIPNYKLTNPHSRSQRSFWFGGSESFMFNKLEDIANSPNPRTPVLGVEIPDSLLPIEERKKNQTSCVNWVVQSSGVDYLHLLLVSINISKNVCINKASRPDF